MECNAGKSLCRCLCSNGFRIIPHKSKECAGFIEKNLASKEGSLKRNFKDGKAMIEGFLDDYAWTSSAFIRLYEVSFETHWLSISKQITDHAVKSFLTKKQICFIMPSNSLIW